MGSPYFVHKQVNRIHVVRSLVGLERLLPVICTSMGTSLSSALTGGSERVVIHDIFEAYNSAMTSRSRQVLFLEARYEWHGWEKFQRVIIFDFSGEVRSRDHFSINLDDDSASYILTPLKEIL